MKDTTIQIRYSDKYGANTGCTTVRLPAYIEQAPLPKIKGFFKLAAQNATKYDNAGEVLRLEAYLTTAIVEAQAELKAVSKPKAVADKDAAKEARDEKRRAENWLKRLQKIREDFTAALDKYSNPKRK